MSETANPDHIIAHVALLRALDRLLSDAEDVRVKREALEKALVEKSTTEGAQ
jgi:DNA-binding phage protein